MSRWSDPDQWRELYEGEGCPICYSIRIEGKCRGTIVELDTGYLTTQREQPVRRYCCLVLKRPVVELHDLEEDEAGKVMMDMRRMSGALQRVTGALKLNLEIHGNTIPHLHVHFFPRYVGDRFDDGPIDLRQPWLPDLSLEEFEGFVAGLRATLVRD